MKSKFIIGITVVLSMCLALFPINSKAIEATPPSVSAEGAVLYEVSGKNTVYSKNAHERMGMASTTKIMTALVVLENTDTSDVVTIPAEACGIEGSSIYLNEGETLTVLDLLYALMLQSANDAATALALHVGGSIPTFADMMNERAKTLHLENTHFTNPSGLYDEDHYTTAYDLAKIAATALENETFAEIVSTKSKSICKGEDNARTVVNHNRLISSYKDSIGGKTGFTKATGRCLVHAAKRNGLTLVSVTLNAPDDWNDHKKMLDFGFDTLEMRILAKKHDISGNISVMGGSEDAVRYTNCRDISAAIDKDEVGVTCEIEVNPYLTAPVECGDIVGGVYYKLDGKIIAYSPLVAENNVSAIKHKSLFNKNRN